MSGDLSSDIAPKSFDPVRESFGRQARVSAGPERLKQAGFSEKQIAQIEKQAGNLNVVIFDCNSNSTISDAAAAAEALLLNEQSASAAVFNFNGATMVLRKGDTAASLCAAYIASCEQAKSSGTFAALKNLYRTGVAPSSLFEPDDIHYV